MLKVRLMEAKHNFSRARSTAHDLGNLMHVVIHQSNVDSLTVYIVKVFQCRTTNDVETTEKLNLVTFSAIKL